MAYSVAVVQAQKNLNALGFNAGKVDGLWGPTTKQAVRNFRAAAGLDPDPPGSATSFTAYLDAPFLDAIQIAAAKQGVNLTTDVPAPPVKAGPLAPGTAQPTALPTTAPGGLGQKALALVKNPWVIGGAAGALILAAVLRRRKMPATQPQVAVVGGLGGLGITMRIPKGAYVKARKKVAAETWRARSYNRNPKKRKRGMSYPSAGALATNKDRAVIEVYKFQNRTRATPFVGYLKDRKITNWTGLRLCTVTQRTEAHVGFQPQHGAGGGRGYPSGKRVFINADCIDGRKYVGTSPGDGMYARMRPKKGK